MFKKRKSFVSIKTVIFEWAMLMTCLHEVFKPVIVEKHLIKVPPQ